MGVKAPGVVPPRVRQPAVSACAAALSGIAADRLLDLPLGAWLFTAVAAIGWWALAVRRVHEFYGAVPVLLAIAATAALWHHGYWHLYDVHSLGRAVGQVAQPVCLEAVATRSPRHHPAPRPDPLCTTPQGARTELAVSIQRLRVGGRWTEASGRAVLQVKGTSPPFRAGDQLLIYAILSSAPTALNPGEEYVERYDRAERRLCRLHVSHPQCITRLRPGSRGSLSYWINWCRDQGERALRRHLRPRQAGLAAAVLLGAREQIDAERNELYMTTGTIHLLSISGLHVGILAYGLWWVARLGFTGRRTTLVAALLFVTGYALLTDARPPIVRAAVLIGVMCLARLCGRQAMSFNTLAIAALTVVAINPSSVFQIGTQLSFLAVATMACWPQYRSHGARDSDPLHDLIAASRPWPVRMVRRLARAGLDATWLSFVIWLTSLPLVMYHFHLVSWIGTVLNPIVCLPMSVALFAGFGVMVLGAWAPPLAACCGWLCEWNLAGMEWIIEQAQALPGNHQWVPAPPAWWVGGFYLGLLGAWSLPVIGPPRRWQIAIGLAWLGLGAWLTIGPGHRWGKYRDGELICSFVAVGHGTSVLLELPDGKVLLYDAGRLGPPSSGARPIAHTLWSRGLSHVDALVISHADSDHFNAIPELLERFSIGVLYVSPTMFEGQQRSVEALRDALVRHGVEVRELHQGDRFQAGAATMRVLHPPAKGWIGSDNANSIVLAVEFAGRRLLLPGDLEPPGIARLLENPPLDVDVLMAPHHGSARSSPVEFSRWSTPEWVVVCSGASRDASVARQVYERDGARVLHTAFDGSVCVEWSADFFRVSTYRH